MFSPCVYVCYPAPGLSQARFWRVTAAREAEICALIGQHRRALSQWEIKTGYIEYLGVCWSVQNEGMNFEYLLLAVKLSFPLLQFLT